jgi:4-oxalomesaconate tautomerase
VEEIRLQLGPKMNLGDVTSKTVPKMSLLAPAKGGGFVSTRTFIPHRVHESIGVLGAVSVATACMLNGSVAAQVGDPDARHSNSGAAVEVGVEHPSGFFTVQMDVDISSGQPVVTKSALLRTARMLMSGSIFVPQSSWEIS